MIGEKRMNDQVLGALLTRIEILEQGATSTEECDKIVRTLTVRLSVVEQQLETMRLRYQHIATELAVMKLEQRPPAPSGSMNSW